VRRYFSHAIRPGAPLQRGVGLTMSGRIKAGAWLPFTAMEELDGRSFEWRARVGLGPLTLLAVTDRFRDGAGSMTGRLFGRLELFRAEDEDTTRSAAGRAAVESFWSPAGLLPAYGVDWRAEADDLIVATLSLPPEVAELRLRLGPDGAVRTASIQRWGNVGQPEYGYIPCGGTVEEERRFGHLTLPSRVSVGWWFGTPRCTPFFTATISGAEQFF
jgi:hypothetical protein